MRGPCRSSSGASSACRQRCCVWDGAVVRSAEHRAGPLHANLYVPPLAVERPDACRFEEQASHQYWPVDASYGDSFRASLPAWAEPYSLRASLCARDHGTRADRSIDPCTWIHRSPRVPPSRAGLYPCKCGDRSIDPRTSIGATRLSLDASPHLDPSIPACLSMEVRLSLHTRPLIPVVRAGIDGAIPADPSMQVCASLLATCLSLDPSARVIRSKCACPSIDPRLSPDRTGSRAPCPTVAPPAPVVAVAETRVAALARARLLRRRRARRAPHRCGLALGGDPGLRSSLLPLRFSWTDVASAEAVVGAQEKRFPNSSSERCPVKRTPRR